MKEKKCFRESYIQHIYIDSLPVCASRSWNLSSPIYRKKAISIHLIEYISFLSLFRLDFISFFSRTIQRRDDGICGRDPISIWLEFRAGCWGGGSLVDVYYCNQIQFQGGTRQQHLKCLSVTQEILVEKIGRGKREKGSSCGGSVSSFLAEWY
jgi:hypothetical protein